MRKVTFILLWALILAEAVLLYGLYTQYEALAVEKQAVERRADVLKTLLDQTEKELTDEQGKWQMEKQALLSAQNELKRELAALKRGEGAAAPAVPVDLSGMLQEISAVFQTLWQPDIPPAPVPAQTNEHPPERKKSPVPLQMLRE